LFTGSFHPIEDQQWENRAAWDYRVAPKEAVTLREIFERRAIIRMATIKKRAIQVLSTFPPFLGRDSIKIIAEYLNERDLNALYVVRKIEATQEAKKEYITVTELPLPCPPSSLYIGKKKFGNVTEYKMIPFCMSKLKRKIYFLILFVK
jgi:hypothetical protein